MNDDDEKDSYERSRAAATSRNDDLGDSAAAIMEEVEVKEPQGIDDVATLPRINNDMDKVRAMARDLDRQDRDAKRAAVQNRRDASSASSESNSRLTTNRPTLSAQDREAKRAAKEAWLQSPEAQSKLAHAGSREYSELRNMTRQLDRQDREAKREAKNGKDDSETSNQLLNDAAKGDIVPKFQRTIMEGVEQENAENGKIPVGSKMLSSSGKKEKRIKIVENNKPDDKVKMRGLQKSGNEQSSSGHFIMNVVKDRIDAVAIQEAAEAEAAELQQQRQSQQEASDPVPGAYSGAPGVSFRRTENMRYSLVGAQVGSNLTVKTNESDQGERISRVSDNSDTNKPSGFLVEATLVTEEERAHRVPEVLAPVAEATAVDERATASSFLKTRTGFLSIVCVTAIVVSLIVGLVVGIAGRDNDNSPSKSDVDDINADGFTSTRTPTLAPTSFLESNAAYELLQDLNATGNLTEATESSILLDSTSPQAQAFEWLLRDASLPLHTVTEKIQRFALATFYFATEGGGWINANDWLDYRTKECLWYGISCNDASEVETISMPDNNVSGSIPEISLLGVSVIDLEQNFVQYLSADIGKLTNLDELYLSFNEIQGSLPNLGDLSDLASLDLSNNIISGSIPDFSSMTGLATLLLRENDLTGSIPVIEQEMIQYLNEFDVASNKITGFLQPALLNLPNLYFLDVSDNLLSGKLPAQLQNMTWISSLRINQNQLSGSLISTLGQLRNLCFFDGSSNFFSGSIPIGIGGLCYGEKLERDTVVVRRWCDLPDEATVDTSEVFDLLSSAANGKIAPAFSNLEGVNVSLASRGEVPGGYSLELIKYSFTFRPDSEVPAREAIRDILFDGESGIAAAESFSYDIDGSDENGNNATMEATIYCYAGEYYYPMDLSLADNLLSGEIPTEISETSMYLLDLSNNNLSGSIPELPVDLEFLDMSNNKLSMNTSLGSLGKLRKLQSLCLANNQITGTLDGVLFNKEKMMILGVDTNQTAERKPQGELCTIDLTNNSITGTLPSEIGKLCNRHLFVGHGVLSHVIDIAYGFYTPIEFERMPTDEEIEIIENRTEDFFDSQLRQEFENFKLANVRLVDVFVERNVTYQLFPLRLRYAMAVHFASDKTPLPEVIDALAARFYSSYVNTLWQEPETSIWWDVSEVEISTVNDTIATEWLPPVKLFLDNNRFAGTIPSSLALLFTQESYVDISGNAFTGTLPVELCTWYCTTDSNATLLVDCSSVLCDCDC